jgi:glutamate-ammonia-ligase adenylyltransferase
VETLSDQLAALADGLLAETLSRVWKGYRHKHREIPRFTIIGYGKLGGKELGYASDLDLIFLYEDDVADARALYARFAQRFITWLSTPTGAGILYDTDLRLRPDGASGLLVSSLEAYEDYQLHHAWTWEHQALTRARPVAGDRAIGGKFELLRRQILSQPRDLPKLKEEVIAMRQKMHEGHPNSTGLFDIKHDDGGIVDVEFCVQYMVLAHAHLHIELLDNIGNIALLGRCGALGLLPAKLAGAAADAYRELRRRQHAAKLAGADQARIDNRELTNEREAVRRLVDSVL